MWQKSFWCASVRFGRIGRTDVKDVSRLIANTKHDKTECFYLSVSTWTSRRDKLREASHLKKVSKPTLFDGTSEGHTENPVKQNLTLAPRVATPAIMLTSPDSGSIKPIAVERGQKVWQLLFTAKTTNEEKTTIGYFLICPQWLFSSTGIYDIQNIN